MDALDEGVALMDLTVYPDLDELPREFKTDFDRAEYLARICGAWDFGIFPTSETFELFADWRDIFDRFPLIDSPAYHTFRTHFGWLRVPGGRAMYADYELLDGDYLDPCVSLW
jgi:hypothetical protein